MATKKKLPDDCMPRCQSCAFFQADPKAEYGACHRLPPVIVVDGDGYGFTFALVEFDDWCGEFKRQVN